MRTGHGVLFQESNAIGRRLRRMHLVAGVGPGPMTTPPQPWDLHSSHHSCFCTYGYMVIYSHVRLCSQANLLIKHPVNQRQVARTQWLRCMLRFDRTSRLPNVCSLRHYFTILSQHEAFTPCPCRALLALLG
jgi:hypothetical protein